MGVVQNENDMEGTLEVGMGEFYTDLRVIFHVIVLAMWFCDTFRIWESSTMEIFNELIVNYV